MASRKIIDSVWDKAQEIKGKNPECWRKDSCGNIIRHASYGTHGEYGWDVDHRNPKSKGGTDSTRNLQALHWKENLEKSDEYPYKKK